MSRHYASHYSSAYRAPRRGPRWPWVFGLLIVVAFSAVGGVLVRGDVVDLNALRGIDANPAAPTVVPVAANVPPTTVAGAPAPTTETPLPVDEIGAPGATTAPTPADDAPRAEPTATVAPTATPEPKAAPDEVVAEYVDRWSAGDYDGLYDLLSTEAQQGVSREDFVGRYTDIASEAGLTDLKAAVTGDPNLQTEVPIRVEMQSTAVGKIEEVNSVPLVKEQGEWKVAWTPSLIFKDLGADGCVDRQSQPAQRGRILDRNGEVLAFDGPISRVVVVPDQITDERKVLQVLSKLTGDSEDDVKATYDGKPGAQYWIVKDFPQTREQELINAVTDLPGVGVQSAIARVYPQGALTAHVVGYVSRPTADQIAADSSLDPSQVMGQAGVEAGGNQLLTGKPGGRLVVVQCETRAERHVIAERKPVPAKDLTLSIDIALQQAADEALTAQGDVRAAAVVLDPRDGAVLAMVSHPTYDPNGFILGFSDRDARALGDEKRKPLLNRAAQAAYPTGSIFKVITTSAALVDLGYTGETGIDCPSTFSLQGSNQVWEDWTVAEGLGPQGYLTLHQALVNSCNTVFYQIGRDLDLKDDNLLPTMAKTFGLGAPTEIPYLPEVSGTVPDPKWKLDTFGDYWATGDAVNLAIGQGFLEATPLQMAVAYAAIANGGDVLQPYIVAKSAVADGATTKEGKRVVRGQLPLDSAQMAELQSALRDQTSDPNGAGSVRVFGDFDWPIAGKTGTAQNQVKKTEKPHSWFAAFGPYGAESTIASAVMIENVGEGVSYAAPVTRQIYEAYLASDLIS